MQDVKWTVVKEWSGGAGARKTETFSTSAPKWRVSWKTLGGDPDPIGSISVTVRSAAGDLVTTAANVGQKNHTGSFSVQSKPGDHYLEIDSADRKWSVAVEQPA
jgi:hypothetical protein